MILPKMTYEEMRREIERDTENFHRWLPHQRRRILEVARRCKSFPSHMMMRYPSPRKNNWLIHVLLTSTNMSGAFITYCIVRRDEEGVFIHLVMENAPGMVCQDILTPHYLKRYAERTGRVGLSAEQLAEAWMTNNYDTICDNTQSLSGVRSQTGTQWHGHHDGRLHQGGKHVHCPNFYHLRHGEGAASGGVRILQGQAL